MDLYKIIKRLMDIVGSILGIILFSPFLIGGCIWSKIVSFNGPILADTPSRVGKNRKPFKLFKFRSMIPNAHQYLLDHPDLHEEYKRNGYKLDPDPRLLPGAKFIRKSSIDEMPQVFNILMGDMSLVGPRAYYSFEIEDQLKKYPEVISDMELALSVKPGLTGLWQISGRSALSFPERVKLDAKYAKTRSVFFDILIILKTPYVVITGKGAY